ncbi:hypothetical protein KA183_18565 [bacterium]|nr:hypothetical protein [bacterium]
MAKTDAKPEPTISSRLAVWDDVNIDFRKHYAKAISEKRKKLGPVIICSGGEMILLHNASRSAVNVVPEKFHFFKTVAHVPLTVYVLLDNHCDETLEEPLLNELSAFKKKYNVAGESFKDWKLDQKTLDTQQSMLDDTNSFVDKVLAEKKVSRKMLDAFAVSTRDRIYKNADAAVLYELGKTDNQIALWKKSMSEDEWDKLKVIVVSPHMPRNQNRQMIYFQSLLGEKEEGNRIIYMDGEPNQEEKALNLLGVHELDRDIAIAFFRDPWRMHRDLLGDAGKKFVKMHKPSSGGINLD